MDVSLLSPVSWSLMILIPASLFTVIWFLDSITHKELVEKEISLTELQTHRNILIASVLMEFSLIGMYWSGMVMLPVFMALFITRTAHEFIDELKYHSVRCGAYENYLHLGMWITVLIKTFAMFCWGFFGNYSGLESLHVIYYSWAGIIAVLMAWIGWKEWGR